MNILLSSVGRRPYLVRWFQDAVTDHGLPAAVIAADLDPLAPARSVADEFVVSPPVADPTYKQWLSTLLDERDIALAVSINDFELSVWARLPSTKQWGALVRVSPSTQELVEDKFLMDRALRGAGVLTPRTWLGSELPRAIEPDRQFVVKGRYGSASRGLRFTDGRGLEKAIASAVTEVTTREGQPALVQQEVAPESLVIVQDKIEGVEYGLDVICDLAGSFAGTLARKKISMRAGETDRAESVDPAFLSDTARTIAKVVPHSGSIDLDIMVTTASEAFVIDINPRFGGGYPFSHVAGARVPHAYVAWASAMPLDNAWLTSQPGVIGGKCVETVRIP